MNEHIFTALMMAEVEAHRDELVAVGYDVDADDLMDMYNVVIDYGRMMEE